MTEGLEARHLVSCSIPTSHSVPKQQQQIPALSVRVTLLSPQERMKKQRTKGNKRKATVGPAF